MKKLKVIFVIAILLSAGSSFQQVLAQEKTKAEQEKEIKLQQVIEDQKKAMADQKKAQEDQDNVKWEQKEDMDAMEEAQIAVARAGDKVRVYSRGGRNMNGPEPFVFDYAPGDMFFGHSFGGDDQRTTWDFSKTIKESSFARDYSFDVEKTVKTAVMSVTGDCKAGAITIKIVMPNGKSYSDIVIDEFGNLNWRKSFNITETENQDKTGEWKFQITSTKATGYFKISLQTF